MSTKEAVVRLKSIILMSHTIEPTESSVQVERIVDSTLKDSTHQPTVTV